jgi:hypothetical protein
MYIEKRRVDGSVLSILNYKGSVDTNKIAIEIEKFRVPIIISLFIFKTKNKKTEKENKSVPCQGCYATWRYLCVGLYAVTDGNRGRERVFVLVVGESKKRETYDERIAEMCTFKP